MPEAGYQLIKKASEKALSEQLRAEDTLTPTLLIGVGGTGGEVLLRIRKKFFERSKEGRIDEIPIISYLFIDTDVTDKHINMDYFEKAYNFKQNERVNATVGNYKRIIENLPNYPLIKRWWYPDQAYLSTNDIDGGAGQIRAYSRLAFFENFEKIKNAINRAIGRCSGAEASTKASKRSLKVSDNLNIYVIASLAGGTGSGMVIDLGYLLQHLNLSRCRTAAFLVLPKIFNLNEKRIFYNSYATLKELEYFSRRENDFDYKWDEQTPKNPISGFGPYSFVYLIDGVNETGLTISGNIARDSIFEMLAENLFQDFSTSAFANYKRSVRINLSDYLHDQYVYRHRDPNDETQILQTEEFPCRYLTFGLATLTFPADRVIKACAYKLAEDIMNFLCSGEKQEDVRNYVMNVLQDKLRLSIGSGRNDFLDALYNSRDSAGGIFESKIDHWLSSIRDKVSMGFTQETASKADYIRGQVNQQEQLYFREDNLNETHWKDWGEIFRAIYQNKEDLLKRAKESLRGLIDEIINSKNKGLQFAKGVLEEISRILQNDDLPYKPSLAREARDLENESKHVRETYQAFLESLKKHESWGLFWPAPFLRGITIDDDITKILEQVSVLFSNITKKRARIAAVEVIEQLVKFIGSEGAIDVYTTQKEEGTGLIGELDKLGGSLENLSRRYKMQKESFQKPIPNYLSYFVYNPEDLEKYFYRKYIKPEKIGTYTSEILQNFQYGPEEKDKGISIMSIPLFLNRLGSESFEAVLVKQTDRYFMRIKDDFDVLDMFYYLYKKRDEREAILRNLYKKSKIWLQQSQTEGAFKLDKDIARKRLIIGISKKSPNCDDFCRMVKELNESGEPPINIFDTDIRHEIIFFNEAGGFPLSYSSSIYELRDEYDKAECQKSFHLHIDKEDFKFKDVMAMSSSERKNSEQAKKIFLLGIILNIIKMREERGIKMYYYEERVGLREDQNALGSQQRAIDMLTINKKMSVMLDQKIMEKRGKIYSEPSKMKKYYALLDWYISNVYIKKPTQDESGIPLNKAPFEYRIIKEEMLDIEKEIKKIGPPIESCLQEITNLQNIFDTFTKEVGDRKALA